jgi:hypothetical protein
MRKQLFVIAMIAAGLAWTGCSKSSAPVAQAPDAGPDNAMTRYVENLAQDERRAQQVADKANAVIARDQEQTRKAAEQQPQ